MSGGAGRSAYPDLDAGVSREVLAQLDEAATCSEHWKILITAGMGFFTDAYDLFIIGVAATIITSEWHIAGYQKSLLSSLALLTSAAGAICFGRIADKLGRRTGRRSPGQPMFRHGSRGTAMVIRGGCQPSCPTAITQCCGDHMDSRISDRSCGKPTLVSFGSGALPEEEIAVRLGGWPPRDPLPDGSSSLQVCVTGDPPIVELAGDIDEWTYPELARVLAKVATAGKRRIRVDLAGVEYCDVAGLRAIVSLVSGGDGRLRLEQVVLAHLPGSLRTALRILGWDAAAGLVLEEGAC